MLADAVHSLSDFITDLIVLIFVKISNKPQDKDHDYGHGKYETLATALIGTILFIVGLSLLWKGGIRIYEYWQGETLEAPGTIALIAALVSIAVKELLYQYTRIKGKNLNSQAVIANAWHHRSDAFSSIGTSLGIGGAILLGEDWRVLDPIAAVIVSFLIMKVSIKLLIPCVEELLEKSLPDDTEDKIREILLDFPGVSDPHNLRTRRIGNRCAVDVHVRMNGDMPLTQVHDATREMERKIREIVGVGSYVSIHVEPEKPEDTVSAQTRQ